MRSLKRSSVWCTSRLSHRTNGVFPLFFAIEDTVEAHELKCMIYASSMNTSLSSNMSATSVPHLLSYNIGKLRKYLDQASTEKLVHSFVTSRLDSCNSLLFGLPSKELDRLQRVHNSAARLVTSVRGRVHICSPFYANIFGCRCVKRIVFKIILLTFKISHGLAPQYLKDLLSIYKPTCSLSPFRRGTPETTTIQRYPNINLLWTCLRDRCSKVMESPASSNTCNWLSVLLQISSSWAWFLFYFSLENSIFSCITVGLQHILQYLKLLRPFLYIH